MRIEELTARAAAHALETGPGALRLRPLAAALGTSDRMLLYYFKTKEGLIEAVLGHVVAGFQAAMDAALPAGRVAPDELLKRAWGLIGAPEVRKVAIFWLELLTLAMRGEEPYARLMPRIHDGLLEAIASRVDAPQRERRPIALAILAQVDGLAMLREMSAEDVAEQAIARARKAWRLSGN